MAKQHQPMYLDILFKKSFNLRIFLLHIRGHHLPCPQKQKNSLQSNKLTNFAQPSLQQLSRTLLHSKLLPQNNEHFQQWVDMDNHWCLRHLLPLPASEWTLQILTTPQLLPSLRVSLQINWPFNNSFTHPPLCGTNPSIKALVLYLSTLLGYSETWISHLEIDHSD